MGGFGITNPAETHFERGGWHWTGSKWVKVGLLQAYSDVLLESLGGTAAAARYEAYAGPVPSGEIWVLQTLTLRNFSNATANDVLYVYDGTTYVYIEARATGVQYIPLVWNGALFLPVGYYAGGVLNGCTVGDTIQGAVLGYKIDVS